MWGFRILNWCSGSLFHMYRKSEDSGRGGGESHTPSDLVRISTYQSVIVDTHTHGPPWSLLGSVEKPPPHWVCHEFTSIPRAEHRKRKRERHFHFTEHGDSVWKVPSLFCTIKKLQQRIVDVFTEASAPELQENLQQTPQNVHRLIFISNCFIKEVKI